MATPTYDLLDSVTLSSSASSVTFSSIDQSYGDLIVTVDVLGSGGDAAIFLRFNSDSGSNYAYVQMNGNGGSTGSSSGTLSFILSGIAATTSNRAIAKHQISDYSATDKQKSVLSRGDAAIGLGTYAVASRWSNTSAITSIQVYTGSNSYAAGSTFYLYGVAA